MSLKQATDSIHSLAEQTKLSQLLVNGSLTHDQWNIFLVNQHYCYKAIEDRGLIHLPEILRCDKIWDDYFNVSYKYKWLARSSILYADYIDNLSEDKLWAHIYVRYLGDIFGGQMIKKATIWPSTCLDFDKRVECISYLRENTLNCDPQEAIKAFQWVINIYDDIVNIYDMEI